ncbi:MAG: hypothetical protein JWO63_1626 [Frankiales bacterium]|jgi:hypothetical protein|nr:hypothetical protein [Frankiales bacterium]
MARVAFDDSTDDAHITVGLGYAPSTAVCGARVAGYGALVPRFRDEWPVLEFAWCEACVKVFAPS